MRFFIVTVSPFNKKFFDALSEGVCCTHSERTLADNIPLWKAVVKKKMDDL